MSRDFEEYCSDETDTIFEAEELESSADPPMNEWSSLMLEIPEENQKKILHSQGLYDSGSGELCTKYIGSSNSSIFKQLYYNYPAVPDPGIHNALLSSEKPITYPYDGQDLYIATCKEIGQVLIKTFHRGLVKEDINLAYYCVDPRGVRAMALALTNNNTVKTLNLTENFLNDDACYHLGEMLTINSVLQELNLSGCKIKSSGAKRLLKGLPRNRSLKILNLDKNELSDYGAEYIANAVTRGLNIQELSLSYNNISAMAASALAGAFETRSKFVKLDLSWNSFIAPGPTYSLLARLGESETIREINLSWNALAGPRIGTAIKLLMKAPNLRYLNLSNNALSGEAVINLIGNIEKANNLETLDLSFNPLTPVDALSVLLKVKSVAVYIQNLLLENIYVNLEFLEVLKEVKQINSKKNFFVIHGEVVGLYVRVEPDMKELVLKRADYLSKRSKKRPVDIALIILSLVKNSVKVMAAKDFIAIIRASGAPLDTDLIDTIVDVFGAPSTPKNKKINLNLLADYVNRLWPDRKLPPTPPPVSVPEPLLKLRTRRNRKDKSKRKNK